jgi:hypothetical protein
MSGLGKRVSFFDFDWKSQRWNLVVVAGAMLVAVLLRFIS